MAHEKCNDLKFYFRYNTLNSKGHEICFICLITSKIRELNLLVMANIKISLQILLKITTPVMSINCHFRFFINVIVSAQNIFMSPASYEVWV